MSQKRLKCRGDDGFVAAGTTPPPRPVVLAIRFSTRFTPKPHERIFSMEIPEDAILEMLDGRGDDAKAQRARAELPDNVDTDRDQRLPAKFGP
jgi:hypothetical protein